MRKKEKTYIEYGAGILLFAVAVYFLANNMNLKSISGINMPFQPSFVALNTNNFAGAHPLITLNQQSFSIAGEQPTNISYVGQQLTASFSVPISSANLSVTQSTSAVSTECDTFVYDNATQGISSQGTVSVVSTSPFTSSISFTPQTDGVYIFGAICQTATTSFNVATNTWNAWSSPVVANQKQLFAVKVETPTTPPPSPQFSLSALINSIVTAITNFLTSIGL